MTSRATESILSDRRNEPVKNAEQARLGEYRIYTISNCGRVIAVRDCVTIERSDAVAFFHFLGAGAAGAVGQTTHDCGFETPSAAAVADHRAFNCNSSGEDVAESGSESAVYGANRKPSRVSVSRSNTAMDGQARDKRILGRTVKPCDAAKSWMTERRVSVNSRDYFRRVGARRLFLIANG